MKVVLEKSSEASGLFNDFIVNMWRRERNSMEPEETSRGFLQTLERNYTKGLQYQYFLKGERVFFWNNKLKKMLSWILKLKIIFLYKWYSEINYTTKKKKKKKKSTQYSLQSIQHREKPFLSLFFLMYKLCDEKALVYKEKWIKKN